MPPRLDPESAESELIALRLTGELLAALDAEVARQREANPDVYVGRSNVLRGLVRRALVLGRPPPEAPSAGSVEAPAPTRAPRVPRAPRARPELTAGRAHVEALRATMSTKELAAAAGVSNDTIAKIQRGGTVAPATIERILQVPVEGGAQ